MGGHGGGLWEEGDVIEGRPREKRESGGGEGASDKSRKRRRSSGAVGAHERPHIRGLKGERGRAVYLTEGGVD